MGGEYEVELYEGGEGGCKDTYIDKDYQLAKNSGAGQLKVGNKQKYAAIVKFDLSPVPQDAEIEWAQLRLFSSGNPMGALPVDVHYITRTNVISEACWTESSSGVNWGSPGCGDTTSDRRPEYEDRQFIDGMYQWFQWDVTKVVRGWVNDGLLNNGLLLRGGSSQNSGTFRFDSSEASVEEHRARLVVHYLGAPPIHTPTPSDLDPYADKDAHSYAHADEYGHAYQFADDYGYGDGYAQAHRGPSYY